MSWIGYLTILEMKNNSSKSDFKLEQKTTVDSNKTACRKEVFEAVKKYLRVNSLKPISPESKIPSSGKVITEDDVIAMVDASIDAWLTAGRFTSSFENKLSEFTGIKTAQLVNSGSSANLIAISSLTSKLLKEKKLNPGDEVITVAAGFATTISPILQNGLVPVFIDVDFTNLNIDIEKIKGAITNKTKAIFVAILLDSF